VIYLWLKKYEMNVFLALDTDNFPTNFKLRSPGTFEITAVIPPGKLSVGEYTIDIGSSFHYREYIQQLKDCCSFKVESTESHVNESRASEGFIMGTPVNWLENTKSETV
jgi:hypothetical protein